MIARNTKVSSQKVQAGNIQGTNGSIPNVDKIKNINLSNDL